ncbi:peroxide stress protein YaaA [Nocardioides marmoriginsengisoli]|uniref:Peroxide stress protein YaaA n=1 Tax=Nocardioides marmoriginsengisoli TaxID=661483 RepID=A0A3N0CLN9_9ACTN|nr:peroxide stress protein YaaA [Nocardioides marmoriginsengisoli]RNL64352.1 peroxide stress protein YaaA [Nocardioides marmoriginsengisoli]
MLILLPPSEGKAAPRRGKPLALDALDFAGLAGARTAVLEALVDLCATDPAKAAEVLGLGPTQAAHVDANAALLGAPAARADRVYTGVLYDALGLTELEGPARTRATRWLAIMSSAFGVVRPNDPIPAYRLSGDTNLPGIGIVSSFWRDHLDAVLTPAAGNGLVVDLRSGMYAGFWRPPAAIGPKVATMRVLHEVGTERKVVSHFNKATKGRIVRDLLLDGSKPRTPAALAEHLGGLGWHVELGQPKLDRSGTGAGQQLDVIVREL